MLPHAWLFSGPIAANQAIAQQFCKWLLCNDINKATVACNNCKSCHLFEAQTHPDFCLLTPQEQKSTILIDEVRSLTDFVNAKPQFGSHKVVLLYPAEAMHKQAANSLLKSLEESSGNTKFFLLTKHTQLLLKTIVSRCQVLNLSDPTANSNETLEGVLQIANDLKSLWVDQSISMVKVIEQWLKLGANDALAWLELALLDLLRFKYTQDTSIVANPHINYLALDKIITAERIWSLLDKIRQAQYWFANNHKPNLQLLLEDMFAS